MRNFHTLKVVCRGNEAQLQVGENVNKTRMAMTQKLILN